MKKALSVALIIILSIIGIFSLVNIFHSLWYIISLESFNTINIGLLVGKIIFTALVFMVVRILIKLCRASQL
ncbi:TPA: hypothetical protein RFS98_001841 [Klebsiella aerogenes]|uniref:hypothetical protein n=1 Tax=Klebsiella aerogenes TaxID=548 RepID=UPI0027FAFE19|nr:hypothetical protein [Klebsiella aerogenes]MDY0845291.1 hypothetical protein [Klebsiella aerogenes]WPS35401.1 hypothetical protein SM905_11770 [Klebsiella aerogenes]HBV6390621.1 hypothetical protein [Klebsiella aerogenes]HDU4320364.1 hypothetical protein [Klebsiella aerogenes]